MSDEPSSPQGSATMEAMRSEIGASVASQAPYLYRIGLQGELILSWKMGDIAGIDVRMHIAIPAGELAALRQHLDASTQVRDTLFAVPPTQSKH